jgi:MoaA/NifB/PqqE/SkfB family radical SAM enzyme
MESYKEEIDQLLNLSRAYAGNPELLRDEIDRKGMKGQIIHGVPAPRADEFEYDLIRYRGFARFPTRAKNFVLARHQSRETEIGHLPTILDIEPVARCNFRCIMCQVKDFKDAKRTEDLSLEAFKGLVDGQYGLTEVKLQGMGEPLMSASFFEMVRYLVGRLIWVRTTVNGSLLHVRENYKALVDSGINEVQTSFDGATREVFEKIRVKSNFEKVVSNLRMFNEYANKKGRLITRMWVLLQNQNSHQIAQFIELAKRMEFRRVTFSIGLGDWGQETIKQRNEGLQINPSVREGILRELLDLRAKEELDITLWDLRDKYRMGKKESICGWPFTRAYVSADMRIVPCCMIGNPEIADLGDARDFGRMWNGKTFRDFRQSHLSGEIPAHCRNCYS